jgi:hypothetical protein
VVTTNKARKAPPLAIAKCGLDYQEYLEACEALHDNILALSIKRQKKDGPKVSTRKKAKSETNGVAHALSGTRPIGT